MTRSVSFTFWRSIRFRLSLLIGMTIFVSMLSVSLHSSWREFERQIQSKREYITGSAQGFAAAIAKPMVERDQAGMMQALKGIRNLPGVEFAEIRDMTGRRVNSIGAGASLQGRDGNADNLTSWQMLSAQYMRIESPLRHSGQPVGSLHFLVNIESLKQTLIRDIQQIFLVMIGILIIGVLIAQVIINQLIAPITHLARTMNVIGEGDELSSPDDQASSYTSRQDETGLLASAFVDMVDKIKIRDDRLAEHRASLERTVEERTRDYRLAKEDAEMANAAKSDFLATMSHEIRTPMNGMLVMAEMLTAANLSMRHRRYAQIISRSGKSLLTIINDILDLSKIESGKLDLEQAPFHPDGLVEDVVSLFWEKARTQALDLAVYVSPNVPKTLIGDATRLNQVVTNLVNNALKFTEQGGVEIRVDAKRSVNPQAVRLRIDVTDTGIGIPADRLDKIFEAFSQADQSTTRRFGGTGLGLAVCQRLMHAMGGDVRVASIEGKGSCFTVYAEFETVERFNVIEDTRALNICLLASDKANKKGGKLISLRNLAKTMKDYGASVQIMPVSALDTFQSKPRTVFVGGSALLQEAYDRPDRRKILEGHKVVCLSDIGDTQSDALLKSAKAHDILPQPSGRTEIAAFIGRALAGEFRGVAALQSDTNVHSFGNLEGVHVLAADDNAVNREVLKEALSTLGVTVDFAEHGQEALDKLESDTVYDLVFMDGSMPVLDGFEATKLIREKGYKARSGQALPVICLTAQVSGVAADYWKEVGMDDCLFKPFTIERLVSVFEKFSSNNNKKTEIGKTKKSPDVQGGKIEAFQGDLKSQADVFDEKTLAMLDNVSTELRAKVWRMFLLKAEHAFEEVCQAARQRATDASLLKDKAHALKSMCLSAGVAQCATVSAHMETLSQEGASDQNIATCLQDMEVALQISTEKMQAWLEENAVDVKTA